MKRMVALVCLLSIVVAGFSGCASTQIATDTNGLSLSDNGATNVAHVQGTITGFYFLGKKPLLTAKIEGLPDDFGTDTANIRTLVWLLSKTAQDEGASKIIDLQTQASSTVLLYPIPFLFSMKRVSGSANGVK